MASPQEAATKEAAWAAEDLKGSAVALAEGLAAESERVRSEVAEAVETGAETEVAMVARPRRTTSLH